MNRYPAAAAVVALMAIAGCMKRVPLTDSGSSVEIIYDGRVPTSCRQVAYLRAEHDCESVGEASAAMVCLDQARNTVRNEAGKRRATHIVIVSEVANPGISAAFVSANAFVCDDRLE